MHCNLLHVITAISNPLRLKSRIKLYRDFEAHMLASGGSGSATQRQRGAGVLQS